ncbi:beta strand repeat-containing protein, partial [Helicobacter pullorum]|uniref:beta strand repeat-containing protein n=1 Tax=Helicobacter pullorum TaxID=35818 RepID=UPI0013154D65
NKIQTTKIQDSKIQLESNLKDLAKLESNSPKLKDSKVSKTSKDSMKLESSPKLDSKTSQKSNSKSKSPKIQKVKNTCDSKKPTKSKNSSKLKSFIRTIPISIALASALSSQAVADWNNDGKACGNGYDCTISSNIQLSNGSGNIQIIASGNTGTLSINQGVHVQQTLSGGLTGTQNGVFEIKGPTQGFTNNGTITAIGSWRNIVVGGTNPSDVIITPSNTTIGSIVNNGKIVSENANILLFHEIGSIVNTGTMILNANSDHAYRSVFAIESQTGADLIFEDQSLTQSTKGARNIIWTKDKKRASSLGEIVAKDNARLEGNFDFNYRFTGESITFQDSASMTGNISLAGNSTITNGITIGGNSTGGSGNNASLTGNISIEGQSRISKILIDGSNMGGSGINGTPKLDGNITLNTSNGGITNGITIANGGTLDGNINARNSSRIGGIAINNGSLIGSISLTNSARIQGGIVLDNSANMTGNISLSTANSGGNITIDSINIGNGSTMTGDISLVGNSKITDAIAIAGILEGNVSAIHGTGGNGTINRMDISGEITKEVQLDNNSKISTLNLNSGTITEGINFQGLTTNSNGDTATIDNLTLSNDAHIGGIDIGNTSGGNAKGVISNLTLNGTSSIGSIVNNRGTISELTLNNDSTITNGITNAVEGNIGTITSNTNNINNTITNSGTINELVVSKGTITYIDNSNSGVVDSLLQVEDGATLKMGSSGNGTITIGSDLGSVLDLKQGSTFEGNLKNASVIKEWKNVSNIDGS